MGFAEETLAKRGGPLACWLAAWSVENRTGPQAEHPSLTLPRVGGRGPVQPKRGRWVRGRPPAALPTSVSPVLHPILSTTPEFASPLPATPALKRHNGPATRSRPSSRRFPAFQAHKIRTFPCKTVQKPYKNRTNPYKFRTPKNAPASRRQMLPADIRLAARRRIVRLPRRQSWCRFLLPARQETRLRLVESGHSQARIHLRGRRATVPKSVRLRAKIDQMSSRSRQKHPKSARKNTHKCRYID